MCCRAASSSARCSTCSNDIAAKRASSIAPRARRSTRLRPGWSRRATARVRITPASTTDAVSQPGCLSQRGGRHHRGDGRVRHGDRSIRRPIRHPCRRRRNRSSTTSRSPVVPGRDGLEAECVLVYSAADFLKWRVMLERNGELSDERRSLLRDMERYAARVGCRHRSHRRLLRRAVSRGAAAPVTTASASWSRSPMPVTLARKILSAVARVGQRFGTAHVTNVLRGSDAENVRGAGTPAEHVRIAQRGDDRRSPRLHRSTARTWPAAADRRQLSGAAADGVGCGPAEGRVEPRRI